MLPSARIYDIVSQIPKGKVATYKDVAKKAQINNPRLVGLILHRNTDQENIPCHRVVRSDGTIASGYAFGGPAKQEEKLRNEGVQFLPNGRINVSKSLYQLT